jgi:hypothetical protein
MFEQQMFPTHLNHWALLLRHVILPLEKFIDVIALIVVIRCLVYVREPLPTLVETLTLSKC